MAFKNLLNHKCNIYHMIKSEASPGYGLPASPSFDYPDDPDIANLSCHFSVRSSNVAGVSIVQKEPQAELQAKTKLALPAGTDVRLNDKIVECSTGYEYTAEIPKDIRGHHTIVILRRTNEQRPL